jgi:hypothetical protein
LSPKAPISTMRRIAHSWTASFVNWKQRERGPRKTFSAKKGAYPVMTASDVVKALAVGGVRDLYESIKRDGTTSV